jgi:HD-GYP domain-containing protein (c-di-GMP phosphodiesterase class II)
MTKNTVKHTNPDLSLHIAHTAHLFGLFANRFNFDGLDKEEIANAILLHDFGSGLDENGNIVPIEILTNDSHDDDYSHSRNSCAIALSSEFSKAVQDVAYYHHEDV